MAQRGDRDFDEIIRGLIDRFSVYAVPLVIALFTFVALFWWEPRFPRGNVRVLAFQVLKAPLVSDSIDLYNITSRLKATEMVEHQDTHLSEAPFWFLFSLPGNNQSSKIVEFPSRHATAVSCWNAETLQLLGSADRSKERGGLRQRGTGFVLTPERSSSILVVCEGKFSGPARLTIKLWDESDFESALQDSSRDSGLLDGGLGILALFVLITAIVNREWIYVLFAVWLVTNLRLAALSEGWDTQWLGHELPAGWLSTIRQANISFYYVLTVALFNRLFGNDLKRVGHRWLLRWNLWSCLPMLAAIVMPYGIYLPLMWVMTGIAGSIIVFLLTRILFVTRSRVAMWFSLSLAVAMFSGFSEVIAAALGFKGTVAIINSVTAALFSSLIAALAIAQQMREERLDRLRAESALRSTYEQIPIGLFTLDHAGCIIRANPALGEMLGVEVYDGSSHWADYFGKDYWKRLVDDLREGSAIEMELCDIHSREEGRWFLMRARRVGASIEGSLQDISARIEATAKLTFLADHDSLTGIFNRRGVERRLSDAIVDDQTKLPCQLAYIDLDRFKLINDLYGHGTGDEVLRQICQRVQPVLTDKDAFGRVGGDEFVIVFRRPSLEEAAENCRQLIASIEGSPFIIDDKAFRVGGCIGLVEVGPESEIYDVVASADRACREAKKGSGGQLVVYEKDSPAFNEREHELHILKRFGVDAAPEGLFLVMQPIMSLHAPYDSLNFEVLLRMYRPDNSIEPAWRVINTAEKHGRIALIDRWVLKSVLEWLDLNFDALPRTRFVSVNLSGGSLNDERFIEDAFALIAQHPRSASRICFEITESVAVSDIDNTLRFVNRVREFGAKVALDDFGVGYTSFSYLHSLSADVLKIDGSLVSAALAHPANLSIIEAVANLSGNLGMTSIAEWAGDVDTVKAMVDVGIDYVQSYAVGRPQMPESIVAARSSADFIQDKQIEEYVRKCLVAGVRDDVVMFGRRRGDLH